MMLCNVGLGSALWLTLRTRSEKRAIHEIADLFATEAQKNYTRAIVVWLSGFGLALQMPAAWLGVAYGLHEDNYLSIVWTLCGALICALACAKQSHAILLLGWVVLLINVHSDAP